MPLTVTVRVSVVVALLLVGSGTALYVVGGQDAAPEPPETRIEVSQVYAPGPGENFSALTHEQRAVFLLAVDPEDGSYATNDTELAAAIDSMPDRVRHAGTAYEVDRSGGHVDTLSDPFFSAEVIGTALAVVGGLALMVTEINAFRRR